MSCETEQAKKNLERALLGVKKMNDHEIENYFDGYAKDLVLAGVSLPQPIRGIPAARKWLIEFGTTFPDLRIDVEHVFVECNGKYVCYMYTCHGTKTNGFHGLPPTDKPFSFTGTTVAEFNDAGEIAVSTSQWDESWILQQLGAIPKSFGGRPGCIEAPSNLRGADNEEVISGHVQLTAMKSGQATRFEGKFEILEGCSAAVTGGPCHLRGVNVTIPNFTPPESQESTVDFSQLPIDGYYRATLDLGGGDSLEVAGWNMTKMLPGSAESAQMMTSSMGFIVGGTGAYEGASGVHNVNSGGLVPRQGGGGPLHFEDFMIFRVVKRQPPAAQPETEGASKTDASAAMAAIPPGVDPETYRLKTVEHLLRRIADFTFFSMPNPAEPNVPIMDGGQLVGVEVHENLHRFDIRQEFDRRGLRVRNLVGQPAAQVHMHWRPIPDDFVARPGSDIPPTPLDPTRSQRFTMLDGHFTFDTIDETGFRGFGSGSTYPVMVDGKPQLRLAAIVDVLEGLGRLKGHEGLLVVNGHIEPPDGLALNILVRLTDPSGKLAATSRLPALRQLPHPDPDNVYLIFLGEPDPKKPVQVQRAPDGTMLGAVGPQRMRLIRIAYDVHGPKGARTKTTYGEVAGEMNATAWFNPFSGAPPFPFQTTDGVFTFTGPGGRELGTVEANMTQGRALPTEMPGAPTPVYRVGGIAPFIRGTGCFQDAVGLFTVDSYISLVPNVLSGLFVMHLSDPGGRVRKALATAWASH